MDEPVQMIKLGKLHTRGVELRNEGMRFRLWRGRNKIAAWEAEYTAWRLLVGKLLLEVSAATAQRFITLNRMPEHGLSRFWLAPTKNHRRDLRALERRLNILEQIFNHYGVNIDIITKE